MGRPSYTGLDERLRQKSTQMAPWSWTSAFLNCKEINLLFEPPNLWYFVTAALAD